MSNPTKLLSASQSRWPLLASLALVGINEDIPLWAVKAAQDAAREAQPANVQACRAQLRQRAELLGALHRRWIVAAILAVLLAMAVVASTVGFPMDSLHLSVLAIVLSAILLPPLAICNGIARDYVAAHALALVLGAAVQQPSVQSAR
jgi:hypothetical protein